MMKNTTGLYKHQRDNRGKRRKLPKGTGIQSASGLINDDGDRGPMCDECGYGKKSVGHFIICVEQKR